MKTGILDYEAFMGYLGLKVMESLSVRGWIAIFPFSHLYLKTDLLNKPQMIRDEVCTFLQLAKGKKTMYKIPK